MSDTPSLPPSIRDFYDRLAPDYHLIFPDWDASMARQAAALDGLVGARLGPGPHRILDCACGIGTQAIGLALRGHHVIGTDLSPVAVSRAATEAAARGAALPTGAADMRALPFRSAAFDVVVCADNSLPHLLTDEDLDAALAGMRRVLRDGGLVVITVRDYDELRRDRPASTPPQVSGTGDDRVVTFQLWHWHDDGERYDLEHFQLLPARTGWEVRVRRTAYRALTRARLTQALTTAGFTDVTWLEPPVTGFYQPVVTAAPWSSDGAHPAAVMRRMCR
ncbi:class I SAM-dependent methyltransferase [Streptomyces sp. HUAS TT20]|uniref:class I SAM-dependent methyltransferase n=1 Tax=Streptomyces sp. HUAS TT20 TaxID=3447509 RepID=UPI0021D8E63F|nr:class I SAM-dependent methyltransferase [Streptomyces sp. HUAS 15-9]UXY25897.1 class I SAM-dependent methyltransferase [Streptomyces sp. HUAS 15-9]